MLTMSASAFTFEIFDITISSAVVITCGENKTIESVENVNGSAQVGKVLRNGMLLLQHNGETYTVSGQRL